MSGRKRPARHDPSDPMHWNKEQYIHHLKEMGISVKSTCRLDMIRQLYFENYKNTPQSEGEAPQDTININDNTKVNNLNHYVSLPPECREDLKMWHIFLKQWNRVSFFYDTLTTSSDDLVLFTDAAPTLGFRGYFQRRWFSSPWPSELNYIMDSEMSMAFRELYPIIVAAVLWNKYWIKR